MFSQEATSNHCQLVAHVRFRTVPTGPACLWRIPVSFWCVFIYFFVCSRYVYNFRVQNLDRVNRTLLAAADKYNIQDLKECLTIDPRQNINAMSIQLSLRYFLLPLIFVSN